MKRAKLLQFGTMILLVFVLCINTIVVHTEGLLPSMLEVVGIAMPSLGESLGRYPDSEMENEDGSITELYTAVTETDFNTFSVYLESKGAVLGNYHAEGTVLNAEIKMDDVVFYFVFDNRSGEAQVTYPEGTYDKWVKNAKAHCVTAEELLYEGKTSEAYSEILQIPEYKAFSPVAVLFENYTNLKDFEKQSEDRKERIKPFKTKGSIVLFGRYEQDNNTNNGPEEIEWVVVANTKSNNRQRALLLSRYALDTKPFNEEGGKTTLEKCSLRAWLNGEFLNSAFTEEEQLAITITQLHNDPKNRGLGEDDWASNAGNDTEDKIFLLEEPQIRSLGLAAILGKDYVVVPTAYAIARGAETFQTTDNRTVARWWLRSGPSHPFASFVQEDSTVSNRGVGNHTITVRPAIWLDLESDIF